MIDTERLFFAEWVDRNKVPLRNLSRTLAPIRGEGVIVLMTRRQRTVTILLHAHGDSRTLVSADATNTCRVITYKHNKVYCNLSVIYFKYYCRENCKKTIIQIIIFCYASKLILKHIAGIYKITKTPSKICSIKKNPTCISHNGTPSGMDFITIRGGGELRYNFFKLPIYLFVTSYYSTLYVD